MKKKLWGIIAGLICCGCLVGAIIYMNHADEHEHENGQPTAAESSALQDNQSTLLAPREDISSVTVTSGGESFTVIAGASGAQPHIRELEGIKQNHTLESALLALCTSIEGERAVEENAEDLKKYGLDEPTGKAEIVYADGTKAAILVGDRSPTDERLFYAIAEGEKKVWLVEDSVSVYLTGKVEDYVSPVISPIAEKTAAQSAKMVISKSGAQDIVLERSGDRWSMTAPIKAALDAESSAGTVNGLYGLNAEYCEVIRPDGAAKERLGLDKPAVTVRLTEASYDVTLKIGNAVVRNSESEKERYYCCIEGGVGTDCIYAVAKEYLPWVDVTVQGLISEIMLPNYLVDLKSISIEISGKKIEYEIKNEGDENRRTTAVTSGGKALEVARFRQFYEFLMKCPTGQIYTNDDKNEAYATLIYNKSDGSEDRLELVKVQGGYGARVNGQMSYLVDEAWVDTLIVDIQALEDGKDILTEFKTQ